MFWLLGGCSQGGEAPDPAHPEPPQLLSLEVVSATELGFEFSVPVRVLSLTFEPSLEIASIGEGSRVRVLLGQSLEPGMRVVAAISAEDGDGNAFSDSVHFERKDDSEEGDEPLPPPPDEDAPRLLINEIRTEFSSPRVEFVEFRALSAGNLGGLRVFVYRSGSRTPTEFEFPPTRVAEGDFVVLHLRTLDVPAVDETAGAHNFRIEGNASRLNKTSAVYVLDGEGNALAAVMLSESDDPSWWEGSSRAHFAEVAQFLFDLGAWKSADGSLASPADAVDTSRVGTAVTRSVSRDETVPNTDTAADWYVTANNGATPGAPNDPRRLGE